jgi:hypothetical protein
VTPPDPILARAAYLLVLAFALALEDVACHGEELNRSTYAAILRSPAIPLRPEHHVAISAASQEELVKAIWRVIASGRFDQALGRAAEYQN